ncbi:MAG: hypothetical protein COY80_03375 [Candidatus Pacebacteria bacterium CG_4_10_14_0_8_um_filter_42_14]|nr:MAG: hypothetical protein COY80_03375 [Candidatus Pacebacteria bacterium CG_4_10_14_0_8_um_filter_42_14]
MYHQYYDEPALGIYRHSEIIVQNSENLTTRTLEPAHWFGELVRNTIGSLIYRADIKVEGLKNIEGLEGGAIFVVAPHAGHTDTVLIRMILDPELRKFLFAVAAGDYWERFGWRQLAASLVRIVPIHRGENKAQTTSDLKQIGRLTLKGERCIFFPQGSRKEKADRFRSGIGRLVLETNGKVPIIPIHLIGNKKLMPPKKPLPKFRDNGIPLPVEICIGPEIDFSDLLANLPPLDEMSEDEIKKASLAITKLIRTKFPANL